MNKSITIESSILKYARYYSGYTIEDVAKKAKINSKVLDTYEKENSEVSLGQLKKLAVVYKRPIAYFLLREIPKDIVLPKDFRIIYSSEEHHLSPKVLLAVRKARHVQSVIKEIALEEIEYNFPHATLKSSPEVLAQKFRNLVGVDIGAQSKWYQPSTALRKWKDAVEKLGVFILQNSLSKEEVSAFCLADEKPYVIVLDSSEHENRRIFSLFHELGHVLLHRSGVCNINNTSRNSYQYIQIEKFCNQFAASFLVPYKDFIEDEHVVKLSKTELDDWQIDDIRALSSKFRVSQEVIFRRLVSINLLPEKKYKEIREDLQHGFDEYKKKETRGGLKMPYFRKAISQNGRRFTALISEGISSNRITMADASGYLGVNSSHVSKMFADL